MENKKYSIHRLVRSEHLNHHGSLFAGIGAQWFVESGYIAAASVLDPHHLVCKQISTLNFMASVRLGDIICFNSWISKTGTTSITTHTVVTKNNDETNLLVEGDSVFVHVDENTKPVPHNL